MSVRVEFYGLGNSDPALRTQGQHWNPDADEYEVDENDLALNGEDTVPTEVALVFSGDEVGVLAGSAEQLRAWLDAADAALSAYEHQQAQTTTPGGQG